MLTFFILHYKYVVVASDEWPDNLRNKASPVNDCIYQTEGMKVRLVANMQFSVAQEFNRISDFHSVK
jgi:hypothetical protein